MLKEQSWEGYESRRGGTATSSSVYNNGVSTQVIFGIPTATCKVGSAGGARLPDLAVGARSDRRVPQRHLGGRQDDDQRRRALRPLQGLAARSRISSAATQSVRSSVPAQTFAETDLYTWNVFAPRIGVVFDLTGDGKTVLKAQLRPLLAQPRRRHRQQRQPEHRQQVGDLHLERPGRVRRLHQRRPALAAGRRGAPPTSRRWRARSARPEHQGAVHARSQRVGRASADRHDGRARRLRLQDRRRPDHDNYQPVARPRRLHRAVHVRRHRRRRPFAARPTTSNLTFSAFPTANAAQFPTHAGRRPTSISSRATRRSRSSMNKRYGNKWSASSAAATR